MPRGDKSKYTDRQKRKAQHIEEGYAQRGVPEKEAERRAWATVNKEEGGGNKSGSGTRRAGHESFIAQGRAARRTRERRAAGCGAITLGEKGRGDPQATGELAAEFFSQNNPMHRAVPVSQCRGAPRQPVANMMEF